ncbi:hypothetical protein TSH100_28480 [Azospirillum sp. TSH100]|uniref:tetratricopeptide repeat protein n=1 Tax=Azospirillum sp. TSH100 TaxID=652764 RepID=UPI000D60933C|nr:tetratricopeptide repeat protein [Azospirillum sp. TSH100]PWC80991.1 hypothetical protein TSH100_28480 [Azospirillum sp. TSH100]QCG87216.1 tetratricopeptide repeat protein [Azospirillum sp. TSH100]
MASVAEAVSAALDHHRAGRLEQAETLYGRILRAAPGHADASHLLGLLLAETGRAADGLVRVDAALAANPAVAAYHLSRARILQALGQEQESVRSLIAAVSLHPGDAEAALMLAPLLRGLAEQLFDAGRPAEAAPLYRRVLALAPADLTAAFDFALCAAQTGRLPDAARAARMAGRLNPAIQRAALLEAECWSVQGLPADAADAARRAVLAGPLDPPARMMRAVSLQQAGAVERASLAYRALLALDPISPAGWGNLCVAAQMLGLPGDAVLSGSRAAVLLPDDAGLRTNLSAALLSAERPRDAAAAARHGLALDPAAADLLLNLGSALDTRHACDAARPALDRALRLRPRDPAILAQLGRVCEAVGDVPAAGALLRRALAATPGDAETLAALGRTALAGKDARGAERIARRVRRLHPDLPAGLLLSGAVAEVLGREDEALAAYDRVILCTPGLGTAFTRRSLLLLRRAFGTTPLRQGRRPAAERVMVGRLGQDGRFGNQLLQYGTLRACADRLGLELEVPDWIGRALYGLDDPLPQMPLPVLLEEEFDHAAALGGRSDACAGRDVVGYFCGDTTPLCSHRALFRSLFTPVGAVAERMDAALARLRGDGRTVVAIHLRRGDFGGDRFWIAPEAWYLDWLAALWPTLDRPVLFLATDAPELASRFSAYAPVRADDLADPLPGVEFLLDHWILSRADALAASNSSFSITAAMLNAGARIFVRPDRRLRRLVPFDPWSGPVLWE